MKSLKNRIAAAFRVLFGKKVFIVSINEDEEKVDIWGPEMDLEDHVTLLRTLADSIENEIAEGLSLKSINAN